MSKIIISPEYFDIRYNKEQIPGSTLSIIEHGANCQLFAYSLLQNFGYSIPPLRSSELWEDQEFTELVKDSAFKPLDLMLYHRKPDAWGAHIGLYVGDNTIIHLSNDIGFPELRQHKEFELSEKYKFFIGAKRLRNVHEITLLKSIKN